MSEVRAPFTVRGEHCNGFVRLLIGGELDMAEESRFEAALASAEGLAPHTLVVDVSQMTFIDSTGINLLIQAHRRARGRLGAIVLVGARPPVEKVLEISGLDRLFQDDGKVGDGIPPPGSEWVDFPLGDHG